MSIRYRILFTCNAYRRSVFCHFRAERARILLADVNTLEEIKSQTMNKKLPVVTIVGRRNVGKSTLFNSLAKEKKAIVDQVPGLTRDIISCTVTYREASFRLLDTPGLDLPDSSELSVPILENARRHLSQSSLVIFLMENPSPAAFDMDLAEILRKLSVPTIIAVNKMDNEKDLENMVNFYEMGFQDILPLSAARNVNISLLLDKILDLLPALRQPPSEPDLRISVVGRPNSGKSTLLNAFIGYDRAVVSEIPGTTRDSVDEDFMYHSKKIRIIDTAGLRRKSRIKEDIEYYSVTRTRDSIRKSDVVIHLIDAEAGLTETDKKISDEIISSGKPMIIAINKWDAMDKDDKTFGQFRERLIFKFYRAEDFPIISISAKNRLRIQRLVETAIDLKRRASVRIETPALNKVMARLQDSRKIPQLGEKIRIYYATQVDTIPPRFKFFVNNTDLFRKDLLRYFEKSLQKEFNMQGIPVIIYLTGKKRKNSGKRK